MTPPCPLEAEVQRRVRLELAALYEQALSKSLELSRRGEPHLAAAYRASAPALFSAERGVR